MTRRSRSTSRSTVALMVVSLLAGCTQDSSVDTHLERARDYQAKGNHDAAAIELKNALSRDAHHAEARQMLGLLYLDMDQGAAAEKELTQAIVAGLPEAEVRVALSRARLLQGQSEQLADEAVKEALTGAELGAALPDADRAALLAVYAQAYLALGKTESAAALINTASTLAADSAEVGLAKALALASGGDRGEARDVLVALLAAQPGFARGWSLLGDLERREGNVEAAEKAYGEAIANRYFSAHDRFGRTLVRIYRGNLEGAKEDLAVLERFAKKSARVAFMNGLIARLEGRTADAQKLFQEAVSYEQNFMPAVLQLGVTSGLLGQWEQAEQHIRRFVSAHPASIDAAKLLASVLAQRGDYAAVQQALRLVFASNPNDPDALQLLGDAALRGGKPEDAVGILKRVVAQEGDSSTNYLKLGLGMLQAGSVEEGIAALEKAAELEPEGEPLENLLFRQYMEVRQFDRAQALGERLAADSSQSAQGWNMLGLVYEARGDAALALDAFERSLTAQPGYGPAVYNLVRMDLAKQDFVQARTRAKEELRRNEKNLWARLALAETETRAGNRDEATKTLERAVALHPDSLRARLLLSNAYLRAGAAGKALALVVAIEDRFPNNATLLTQKGMAQLAAGQVQQAVSTLRRALDLSPDSVAAQHLLAQAVIATGDERMIKQTLGQLTTGKESKRVLALKLSSGGKVAEALVVAREAAAQAPNDPDAHSLLGALQIESGDAKAATQSFQRVTALQPENAVAHRQLGLALMAAGNDDEARRAFLRATEINPSYVDAFAALAILERQMGRIEESLRIAAHLQETQPDSPAGFLLAGDARIAQGRFDEAVSAYEKVFQRTRSSGSLLRLAQALARDDRGAEGEARLREWLGENESDWQARMVLARLLESRGAVPEAISQYEILAKAHAEDAVVLNNLAVLYSSDADPRALSVAERAYLLKPEHPAILDTYGWALSEAGRLDEALPLLVRARELAPASKEIAYHYAATLARSGEGDKARGLLESLIAAPGRFPQEAAARALLERL